MGIFDFFKKSSADKSQEVVKGQKEELSGEEVGQVVGYFAKSKAAVVKITRGVLKTGDEVMIKGHTTSFKQKVDSLQIDNQPIAEAHKGQVIGMKVKSRVRRKDTVFRAS